MELKFVLVILLATGFNFAKRGEAGNVGTLPKFGKSNKGDQFTSFSTFNFHGGFSFVNFLLQDEQLNFTISSLSESCSQDVARFVEQIKLLEEEEQESSVEIWALQMLDAWAKPPEGILSGHVNALGDFDECLAIRAPHNNAESLHSFKGKYCLVYAAPIVDVPTTKVNPGERSLENVLKIYKIAGNAELAVMPAFGSCLPSTCTDQEILEIVTAVFANQKYFLPVATFCSVDEAQKLGTGVIVSICLVSLLIAFATLGTLLELALNYQHISNNFKKSKFFSVLLAFSLISNWKRLFNTEIGKSEVSCLYGIRFLSAAWVILGHTIVMSIMQSMWNFVDAYSTITTSFSILIMDKGSIVVDVFLVIGGFLVSLSLLGMLEKSRGKINVPLLYLNRYLRITLLYLTIICVGTFVFPLLGSGPYWHVAKMWAGYCEKNWWKNLLYINNLPIYNSLEDPSDNACHGISWYLGVDMQLFFLSPFLLFPVWKWKRYGKIPLVVITVVSAILPGVLTYVNNFPPTSNFFGHREHRYSQLAYTPTYMRATPYLIGMCTGLIFHYVRAKAFKLSKLRVVAAWAIAFAIILAVMLAPRNFLDPEYKYHPAESAIFVSGHRTAWSLAISWMIFACATGYGGWINQFLSWKPFIPLGRLTFAIYLVSFYVQFLLHLQYRQPLYFSHYHTVNLFFAHVVMSCLVALVFTLLVESPFMQLLKLLMPTNGKRNVSCKNNNAGHNDFNKPHLPVE